MSFCNTLRTEHICVLFYIYILWISKLLSNILLPEAFLLQNDFKSENVKAVAHFLPIDLVTPCIFHEGSLNSGTNQIQVNVNELNPPWHYVQKRWNQSEHADAFLRLRRSILILWSPKELDYTSGQLAEALPFGKPPDGWLWVDGGLAADPRMTGVL